MLKYLWHKLIQGHDWRVVKISGYGLRLYALLECRKCHMLKTFKSAWTHKEFSYDPETQPVRIDDLLNKIKGK